MQRKRTIAVGDIHGCLEEFDELLRTVEFTPNHDQLVLLGDFMDRGPDPVGVVRRARELRATAVLGNHDEKHLRWRRHEEKAASDSAYKNPMRPLSESALAANRALSDEDVAWLKSLPLTLAVDRDWIAVHAGFEPGRSMDDQKPDKVIRVRYVNEAGLAVPISNDTDQPAGTKRWAEVWPGQHHIVYGHHGVNFEVPRLDTHVDQDGHRWLRYGIDTGCCFGGRLTALVLQSREVVQVRAKGVYGKLWQGDDQ